MFHLVQEKQLRGGEQLHFKAKFRASLPIETKEGSLSSGLLI